MLGVGSAAGRMLIGRRLPASMPPGVGFAPPAKTSASLVFWEENMH